jgi:hypothetical protein
MMRMWLSTIVVLVGAEFNSEIEHQTARDSKEIEDLAICVTDEAGTEVFRTRVVNLQQPMKANTEGHPQGFSDCRTAPYA